MSTCPEKNGCPADDIHHVFLDEELSEEYLAPYRSHLETCPGCRKKLSALAAVRAALRDDAAGISLSRSELDAGFERLLDRMHHRKVSAVLGGTRRLIYRVLPWAAAAMFLIGGAYVFLHRNRVSPARMDGTALILQDGVYEQEPVLSGATPKSPVPTGFLVMSAGGLLLAAGRSRFTAPASIDVFRPQFLRSNSTIKNSRLFWRAPAIGIINADASE